MLRPDARFSGRVLSATEAGSSGSMARTPSHPRLRPITSQPRSSADRVTARMQALRPGPAAPPVRMPIFTCCHSVVSVGNEWAYPGSGCSATLLVRLLFRCQVPRINHSVVRTDVFAQRLHEPPFEHWKRGSCLAL